MLRLVSRSTLGIAGLVLALPLLVAAALWLDVRAAATQAATSSDLIDSFSLWG